MLAKKEYRGRSLYSLREYKAGQCGSPGDYVQVRNLQDSLPVSASVEVKAPQSKAQVDRERVNQRESYRQ